MLIIADRAEINKMLRGHALKTGDRVIEIAHTDGAVEIHIAKEISTAEFLGTFDVDENGKLVPEV